MDRDRSPPKKGYRGRSASPPKRDFEAKGGGRSSSRQRSPGYYASARYDAQSSSRPRNGDRERDNGYGDRSMARRDDGMGSGSGGRGSRRDEGYSERDREKEREGDRRRYEVEAKMEGDDDDDKKQLVEAEKPNFGKSGLLAKETNTVKGVELKYNEPPEARKPLKNWRLYVFKGKEQLDLIHIYRQSAYLIGRDEVVTDIPIAHPSCSKQHAAIQFRQISEKNEFGEVSTSVKPFIIDLDSTNGTHVNDNEIPKSRYYELRNSDVIKFGTSSREYVLLHEDATA